MSFCDAQPATRLAFCGSGRWTPAAGRTRQEGLSDTAANRARSPPPCCRMKLKAHDMFSDIQGHGNLPVADADLEAATALSLLADCAGQALAPHGSHGAWRDGHSATLAKRKRDESTLSQDDDDRASPRRKYGALGEVPGDRAVVAGGPSSPLSATGHDFLAGSKEAPALPPTFVADVTDKLGHSAVVACWVRAAACTPLIRQPPRRPYDPLPTRVALCRTVTFFRSSG